MTVETARAGAIAVAAAAADVSLNYRTIGLNVGAVCDREQNTRLIVLRHGIRDLKIAPTTTHQSVL